MRTENLVHEHVFLGADHKRNERRVWLVIALTASMMVAEIVAGNLYGSPMAGTCPPMPAQC
jgi:Co/Zn/Cd efflux system component